MDHNIIDEEKVNISIVDKYLNSVDKAASRSRLVIVFMIISCILSSVTTWNSRSSSWTKEYLRTANFAENHFTFPDDTLSCVFDSTYKNINSIYVDRIVNECDIINDREIEVKKGWIYLVNADTFTLSRGVAFNLSCEVYENINDKKIWEAQVFTPKFFTKFRQAFSFLSVRKIEKREDLESVINTVRIENIKRRTIDVPFFGVWFYINDLAVIAGVTFIVVLIMLRYSLNREQKNLANVFSAAHEFKILGSYYYLIATKEIFSSPQIEKESNRLSANVINFFWRTIPISLLALPLIIYTIVIYNDLHSYHLGISNSAKNTQVISWLSNILFFVVLFLTVSCIRKWREINLLFDYYWEIRKKCYPLVKPAYVDNIKKKLKEMKKGNLRRTKFEEE